MAKNELKPIKVAVMIMIVLGFAEANYNSPSMKIEPNSATDKLSCPAQCGIDCFLANIGYPICYAICVSKCPKNPPSSLYNCITRCGINKPSDINIGMYSLTTFVSFQGLFFMIDLTMFLITPF